MTSKTELIEAIRAMDDGQWFDGFMGAGMLHHAFTLLRVLRGGVFADYELQELHDQMARVVRYRDA